MINNVVLVGRLTRAVDLRYTQTELLMRASLLQLIVVTKTKTVNVKQTLSIA